MNTYTQREHEAKINEQIETKKQENEKSISFESMCLFAMWEFVQ